MLPYSTPQEQGGDKTLEEKQADAHKQAAVAMREPNMKPNIKQVPKKHEKANNRASEPKKHEGCCSFRVEVSLTQ